MLRLRVKKDDVDDVKTLEICGIKPDSHVALTLGQCGLDMTRRASFARPNVLHMM